MNLLIQITAEEETCYNFKTNTMCPKVAQTMNGRWYCLLFPNMDPKSRDINSGATELDTRENKPEGALVRCKACLEAEKAMNKLLDETQEAVRALKVLDDGRRP